MPDYLIHHVDGRGRATGLVSFDCENDAAAKIAAVAMASADTSVELWSGERHVATVFARSVVQFRRLPDPGPARGVRLGAGSW